MKIPAMRYEGEVWIRLDDHKADLARYKARIAELEEQLEGRRVKPPDSFTEAFGKILRGQNG